MHSASTLIPSSEARATSPQIRNGGSDRVVEVAEPLLLPLCVDLDGTLVKSNTLIDSILSLARHNPLQLLLIPAWILQRGEVLQQRLERAAPLDVTALPYNQPLIDFLRKESAAGRPIYLATTASRKLAGDIAGHLRIFTGVLAVNPPPGAQGRDQSLALRDQFGNEFAYIGNAASDLRVLTECREPMVANPNAALRAGLRNAGIDPTRSFVDRVSPAKAWIRALRLHQWAKNLLVFLPLLLAHPWSLGADPAASLGASIASLIAFLSFGLCASATYIVNDLLDIEADRLHPKKRMRPFAAGNLSALSGLMVSACLLTSAILLASALPGIVAPFGTRLENPRGLLAWLVIYAVSTTAYSLKLKRLLLVDVIALSGLHTVRILAGSVATGISISTWLAGFSIFFFLGLAYAKRFSELHNLRLRGLEPANGRKYLISDIEQLRNLGTSSAFASVVVLTLYISGLDTRLYHHPGRLWLLPPVFLLWISQLWLLASRGELNEDPVVYAITDKRSLMLGLFVVAVVLAAL